MTPEQRLQRRARQKGHRCLDCEHTMFNEQWGEHKCKVKERSIPDAGVPNTCKDFKKKQTNK